MASRSQQSAGDPLAMNSADGSAVNSSNGSDGSGYSDDLLAMDLHPERPALAAEVDLGRIEKAVREILLAIGEDADREGLMDTPGRVARMYAETCSGLHDDPARHLKVTFDADHDEMIMVRDISLYSICEHHLVPFHGRAHVAYIPNTDGRVTGLSKIARLVDGYSRRPQVQERLTAQIANAIESTLDPRGVLVVIEAEHMCMAMRGVKKAGASTVTSAVRGVFRDDYAARSEAMRFIDARR
ncbi:MAG TPA: GTP cyclohydrolase I FolE [Microthrixaceae bacterium]|nr:GTP cyclohydrolase I FolE [Microthrixaceae bacterium]